VVGVRLEHILLLARDPLTLERNLERGLERPLLGASLLELALRLSRLGLLTPPEQNHLVGVGVRVRVGVGLGSGLANPNPDSDQQDHLALDDRVVTLAALLARPRNGGAAAAQAGRYGGRQLLGQRGPSLGPCLGSGSGLGLGSGSVVSFRVRVRVRVGGLGLGPGLGPGLGLGLGLGFTVGRDVHQ